MAMPALDTHKAVKSLRSAGFDDAQAEAVVEQINDAVIENVATKTDIERLATKDELRDSLAGLATKADVEQCATKADLERFRAELREDMLKLFFAMTGVNIAVVSAGIAFLRLTGGA